MKDIIERLDLIARMFEGHPEEVYPPSYWEGVEGLKLLVALIDEIKEEEEKQ